MARKRSKPDTKPVSGMTRLLKALEVDNIPRFRHPHSKELLSEEASRDAVYHVLNDEKHPDRYPIIAAALAAIDGTPIIGTDPQTNHAIYDLTGLQSGHCRSCGAVIYWGRSPKGKAIPLNHRGMSHFLDCPHANQHSRKKGSRQGAAS
jgi:hypothetical protein